MPALPAAIAIVGTGISAYGAIKSANDQNDLDQEKAQVAREQAAELTSREVANEALRNQQATRQKLQFASSYAASGKAGVGLGSQLQIQNATDLQNMISNKETQFQVAMLNQQAGIDTTMGNDIMGSASWAAAGDIASGLGSAARTSGLFNAEAHGGKQGLGSYPSPSGQNGGG